MLQLPAARKVFRLSQARYKKNAIGKIDMRKSKTKYKVKIFFSYLLSSIQLWRLSFRVWKMSFSNKFLESTHCLSNSQMLKRVQHDSVLSFRTRFGICAFILQFYFAVSTLHSIDTKPMIPFLALSDTLPVFDFSFVFNLFNEKIEKRMPTN